MTYPEARLFRSRADGGGRLQLTFSPMRARRSEWAPDGRSIAFECQVGTQQWRIYRVAADGGAPRPLTGEDRWECCPTWAADGRYLAFSLAGDRGIRLLDLESGEESPLEGSRDVHEPAWSPDGRYIAAHSLDHQRLLLFDFEAQRWQELARVEDIVGHYWSGNGEYLHFHTGAPRTELYRVSVPEGQVERIGGLRDSRLVLGVGGFWIGVTPDGSLLHLHDQSIHHIYALDWER